MAINIGPQGVIDNSAQWIGDPTGLQGPKGDKGFQGNTGDKGDKGFQGNTGDKGAKGNTGDKGGEGDTGKQGYQGDTGPKGNTGNKGDDSTVQGDTGPQGDTGAKGDDGAGVNTTWIESSEAVSNGTSYYDETCANGWLSFGLIKTSTLDYGGGSVQGQCYCLQQSSTVVRVQAVMAGTGSGMQKCICGIACK